MRLAFTFLALSIACLFGQLGNPGATARLKKAAAAGPSFPSSGLIHYWAMNEASGSRADSVGSQTLDQASTPPSSTGKSGNCVAFSWNGSSYGRLDTVDSGSNISIPSAFSIAFWLKIDVGGQRSLSAYGRTVTDLFNVGTAPVSPYTTELIVSYNEEGQLFGTIAEDSEWRHCVITGSGSTITVYLDGSQNAQDTMATLTFSDWDYFVIEADNQAAMSGTAAYIDEVGIWNRALTSQEVTDLWNGGAGLFYTP